MRGSSRKKCPRGKKRNPKTGRCKTPCGPSQAVNPITNRCVSKRYLKKNKQKTRPGDEFDDFDYSSDVNLTPVDPSNPTPTPPTPPPDRHELTRSQFVSRLHDVSILGDVPVFSQAPSTNPRNPNQWRSPEEFGSRDIEILKMIMDTSRSTGTQLQGVFLPAGDTAQSPYANCREFRFRGEGSSLEECGVFDVTSGDLVVSLFEDSAKYENALRMNGIIWNTADDALLTPLDFYESAWMGVHGVYLDRCILTPTGVWRFVTFSYDVENLPEGRVHQIIDAFSQHKQEIIAQGDNEVGDDGIEKFTKQIWEYVTLNMEPLVFLEYYDFSGGILAR